jgi:hypothetical protein
MRFHLDETFAARIAVMARELGLDVTSSHEVGRDGSSDESQLALAAGEGRCMVTANGSAPDFYKLTEEFQERGLPHAGVLILPSSLNGSEYAAIVDRLVRWHDMYPDGAPAFLVSFLTE